MIALIIYLTVFFGSAVLLILYINQAIQAENVSYTRGIPDYEPEAPPAVEAARRLAA